MHQNLLQYYSCNSKKELQAKEREYIEELKPTLNKTIPNRTEIEYRIDKKEQIKTKNKNLYEKNKQLINDKHIQHYKKNLSIKIKCEFCKSLISKKYIKKHQKTKIKKNQNGNKNSTNDSCKMRRIRTG